MGKFLDLVDVKLKPLLTEVFAVDNNWMLPRSVSSPGRIENMGDRQKSDIDLALQFSFTVLQRVHLEFF